MCFVYPSTLHSRLTCSRSDIYIPPHQIIDTVNIYHLPHRQRKLSLRFLAWAVLHLDIQQDTHDSIEDARTALQLYEENNRAEAEGSWDEVLEEVYREGKRTVSVTRFSSLGSSFHSINIRDVYGHLN